MTMRAARGTGADLLLMLGRGSVTDSGKMVRVCLTDGVTEEQLDVAVRAATHNRWIPTGPRPLDSPPCVRCCETPVERQSSRIATARVHPAEPRWTFTGKHTTWKPSGGKTSRLFSFSKWE